MENSFNLKYGYSPDWIDQILAVFNKTDMKRSLDFKEKMNRAFQKSQVVASVWKDDRLLAIGRMLTDFEMYSSIFDVAVDPEFQKQGLGKQIMEALIAKAPNTCIHLTSTFGNEPFYHRLGFHFHKTAMASYPKSFGRTAYLDWDRIPNERTP
jgi:ribosomal protein S18 acetylase RimI-like enzyme